MLQGQTLHLIVVYAAGLAVERVAHVLVEDAGGVDLAAMRQMTALVEVEAHEGVARLEHRQQHGLVGLCAGVGLHVGKLGTEEGLDTLDGQCLHLVYHLAAAIVALAGKAFGILVGEITTHGLHHLVADEVLRSNEFHTSQLSLMLLFDKAENFLISFHCVLFVID